MKQKPFILAIVVLCMTMQSIPLFAHHSFANYDMKTNQNLTGVVTRFEWTNPHSYLYLNVTDANGVTTEWAIELAALSHLLRDGWTKDTFKPGDQVTVVGHLAKNGSKLMTFSSITTAGGRTLRSGPAATPPSTQP
jgi:hypothetical protein